MAKLAKTWPMTLIALLGFLLLAPAVGWSHAPLFGKDVRPIDPAGQPSGFMLSEVRREFAGASQPWASS